jgi:two-component system, OmpR family, KDP operon response regulator KdpE
VTRVLVVDDDTRLLRTLHITLTARGYDVLTAPDGAAALRVAARHHPDVIVLDLGLPDVDGVEVVGALRERSTVPVVVLSARSDSTDKVRALDRGADDYVTKPFGTEELLARIRAALRREQARRDEEPVICAGPVSIDLLARRVEVEGQEVHLTPTEYELLRVLVANSDRVLTHRHLLRAALGPEYEDALENLRTFIAQLRRKIEPQSSRPHWIVTEPGVGYRFRPD